MALVDRLPHDVRRVEQHMRVDWRPMDWHRSHVATKIGAALLDRWADGRCLTRFAIVERDVRALAAEHEIRILRIRCGNSIFLNVDGMPVVEGDLAIHRSTIDT